jgi:acyl dehydratase
VTVEAGTTFRHERTCDRYRPLYYAAASGDFNPIHVDAEAAKAAGLPGPILQGMCTFAWLAEAATRFFGDPGRLGRIVARFSRPVAVGDTVTFEGRCLQANDARDGLVAVEITARNGRGEEVLKAARAEWGRLPAALPAASGDDPRVGRRYGPYRYEAGTEKIRDFALAVAGGAPTRVFARPPDPPPHPWHLDPAASPWGVVVAPPTFAAVFAMPAFADALTDPACGIDLPRVLHGEQELRIHRPVRAGDRLVTTGEIASVEKKRGLEVVTVTSRTADATGAPVVDGIWTAVVR